MAQEGSVFVYNVRGAVEYGTDFSGDDLCVSYCYSYGKDWQLVAGLMEGISQISKQSHGHDRRFVWNFPLDVTFTSTNPYGWPQLVLNVYGKNFLGTDVVRGYAATHCPLTPGHHSRSLKCFVPSSASLLQKMIGVVTGNTPEFVEPKLVAQARGREVTRVESQGQLVVSFIVTMKDFSKLGYDCGSNTLGSLNSRSLLAVALDNAHQLGNTSVNKSKTDVVNRPDDSLSSGAKSQKNDENNGRKQKLKNRKKGYSQNKHVEQTELRDRDDSVLVNSKKFSFGNQRRYSTEEEDKTAIDWQTPSTSKTRKGFLVATPYRKGFETTEDVQKFSDQSDDDDEDSLNYAPPKNNTSSKEKKEQLKVVEGISSDVSRKYSESVKAKSKPSDGARTKERSRSEFGTSFSRQSMVTVHTVVSPARDSLRSSPGGRSSSKDSKKSRQLSSSEIIELPETGHGQMSRNGTSQSEDTVSLNSQSRTEVRPLPLPRSNPTFHLGGRAPLPEIRKH